MSFFNIFKTIRQSLGKKHPEPSPDSVPEPEAPVVEHKIYMENAGACMVSKNILSGRGKLSHCCRELAKNPYDNGWIFYSDIDDESYKENPANMAVCDFNLVASIERAVLGIYDMPPGSSLLLERGADGVCFVDLKTGERFDFSGS